jgi:ATP-dependent helicase/nuclease subunit B
MRLACSGLFSWMEKNVTVVTPSRLLAGVAYQQFTLRQLGQGNLSWQRPNILSFGSWLTACWQDARYCSTEIPILLSPVQEHLLWKRTIQETTSELFDADATARMAGQAARTFSEWRLPEDSPHWKDGSDAPHFQQWFKAFQRRCSENGWIIRPDVLQILPDWIAQKLCAPGDFAFPITRRISPSVARIVRTLGERSEVRPLDDERDAAPVVQARRFEEFDGEVEFAARWARNALEESDAQSIAILVPDRATHHKKVERTFLQIFYPGSCRSVVNSQTAAPLPELRAFYVHARSAAVEAPLIAAALLVAELANPRVPVSEAGAVLRSPYIAGANEEQSLRAAADIQLRRRRELDVTLADLEQVATRCPRLLKSLRKLRGVLNRAKTVDTYAGWSRFLGELLQAIGWPGDHEPAGAEQDLLERWKEILSSLSALSLVSGTVTFKTALDDLRQLLSMQSEAPNLTAPVQVLDTSQASGLRCDKVLIAGLSEDTWPPPFFGSPFLPLKLQREHQVPGASPQSLREERERMTRDLFILAPEITATWTRRVSPLAKPFVTTEHLETTIWMGQSAWQSFKPAVLEETDDSQAPEFIPPTTTRGGTSVIRAQSLCPFRAFAEYRLHAASPEEGCLGLDSRERGGNLHKALEIVWQKLHTRDRLRATTQAELETLVEWAATEAVASDRSSPFGQVVAAVEVQRLKEVILEWLAIERDRAQNFTVETVEEEKYLDLGGLRLRLRIDRIDRLANGQLLLIDYKSGEQKRSKLELPRPQEPQLLVYAAGLPGQVDGILFAQLKARDVRPVGFTRDKQFKSKTVDVEGAGWEEFLAQSEIEVERLAKQFKSGCAALDPRNGACDYCSQKPLCRIQENQGGAETEE